MCISCILGQWLNWRWETGLRALGIPRFEMTKVCAVLLMESIELKFTGKKRKTQESHFYLPLFEMIVFILHRVDRCTICLAEFCSWKCSHCQWLKVKSIKGQQSRIRAPWQIVRWYLHTIKAHFIFSLYGVTLTKTFSIQQTITSDIGVRQRVIWMTNLLVSWPTWNINIFI